MNSQIMDEHNRECILCSAEIISNDSSGQNCQQGWQTLLRFLKMEVDPIQTTAPICTMCSLVINQFHAVYQTCEISRLQLDQSLQSIHQGMKTASENAALDETTKLESQGGTTVLRKILFEKCDDRLKHCIPRVGITKLKTFSKFCPSLRNATSSLSAIKPTKAVMHSPSLTDQETKSPYGYIGVTNVKIYTCYHCNQAFTRNETLINHTYLIHVVDIVSSHLRAFVTRKQCQHGITKVFQLLSKNSNNRFACFYCNYTASVSYRIRVHIPKIHLANFVRDVKDQLHLEEGYHSSAGLFALPQQDAVEENNRRKLTKESSSFQIPICSKDVDDKGSLKTQGRKVKTKDELPCAHCPRKFNCRHTRRTHLVQDHTPNYFLSLLSSRSTLTPNAYSIDTISSALAHVLQENGSKFLPISPSHKLVQCPFCVIRTKSPKRHMLEAHFHHLFTSVMEHLKNIEQQEKNEIEVNSSLEWSLSPMSISGTVLNEVIQSTEGDYPNFEDIFLTITDTDFN